MTDFIIPLTYDERHALRIVLTRSLLTLRDPTRRVTDAVQAQSEARHVEEVMRKLDLPGGAK